jgi:hypothetical protein
MMDNFAQILQRLPTNDASASNNHSGGATPFKVQVNFDIPIFDSQIDADAVDRWLNLLEGYFSVHDFSDWEKIIFSLLKAAPHVKDWWETYYEKKDEEEPSLFLVVPTWNSFQDTIKEQYYPVGSYEDKYIQWTMLWQQRDQDVHELTNLFHTPCTKLAIKDSEKHLVLKYHSCLHRYIQ